MRRTIFNAKLYFPFYIISESMFFFVLTYLNKFSWAINLIRYKLSEASYLEK